MKKVLSVLILLQAYCLMLFCAEIKISVIDAEIEIPLEDVTISVSNVEDTWLTDDSGDAFISISDKVFSENGGSLTLSAYLPGYSTKKIRIDSKTTELSINLSIEDVVEGKELVVEEEAYQKTDATTGISVVITKEQFDNVAQIGSIPDVMTAVKTLPGVTYMGSFSQQPSIRGAYPYEMACSMDGTYVYSPFHWSGAVSIFDPMFIKSVKLSHGIFSARNGHATSGLLEISTVEPEDDTIKFSASVSNVITDGIFQIPFTKKAGLVAGYRVSYYDTIPWFYDTLGITKTVLKKSGYDELGSNFKLSDHIRMPNMQDFYGKFYFNPSDRLHITINEFFGRETIGYNVSEETVTTENPSAGSENTKDYSKYYEYDYSSTELAWKNIFSFGSASVQLLPTDNIQINFQGNYNRYNSNRYISVKSTSENDKIWSEDVYENIPEDFDYGQFYDEETEEFNFKAYQDALEPYKVTKNQHYYSYSDTDFHYENSYLINILQGKAYTDISFGNNKILSAGFEEFYKTKDSNSELKSTNLYYTCSHYEDEPESQWSIDGDKNEVTEWELPIYSVTGNRILNSAAYANFEFGDSNSKLQGEAGLRFEYYYIYNQTKGTNHGTKHRVSIGTIPTLNPRISARYKPEFKSDIFQDLTFSAGTGLFSNISDSLININSEYTIEGGKLRPDEDWFSIVGTKFNFLNDFTFQIEGYYKYYLSRFYSIGELSNQNIYNRLLDELMNETSGNSYINKAFCDGKGYVYGFDAMLQKKTGRYFDGYLTYTFIVAKYLNPFSPEKSETESSVTKTDDGDPLGEWYYPYFHRFHTLSAVLNFRPRNGLVYTLTGSVVSGVPLDKTNPLNMLFAEAGVLPDRTSLSFPVNFRIGKSNYYKTSKLQYEWYFGIENIFGFLNKNSLLGCIRYVEAHINDDDLEENLLVYSDRLANFDTGIPVFTFGLRISM